MDEESKKKITGLEKRISRMENFLSSFHKFVPTEADASDDELYEEAVKIVLQYDRASPSLLQRKLQIGFNRAARLIEQLEEKGVVDSGDGSTPRKVLVSKDYLKKSPE